MTSPGFRVMSPIRKPRTLGPAAGAILALTLAGAALAQTAAEKAVGVRQAGFKQIGAAFKTINDEARAGKPDMAAIAAAAAKLKTHAAQVPTWFPKGSGVESGAKTGAKAEIWSDAAGFASASANFQAQANKLQQLAAAGNVDATKAQVRQVGAACQACHSKYREKD